jgi:hypothetical protein
MLSIIGDLLIISFGIGLSTAVLDGTSSQSALDDEAEIFHQYIQLKTEMDMEKAEADAKIRLIMEQAKHTRRM